MLWVRHGLSWNWGTVQDMGRKELSAKEGTSMASKYRKRYSLALLPIRETHIKAIRRYHFPSTRMARVKMTDKNRCWQGCGDIAKLVRGWRDRDMVQPLRKTVWKFLKQLNRELPYSQQVRSRTARRSERICPHGNFDIYPQQH